MELSILAVFLTSFILSISSHPRHSDIIPKDYYKRQILPPIPGYIPVYIKADGEPLVRSEGKKHSSNVYPPKAVEHEEKNLSKGAVREVLSRNQDKKSDRINVEKALKESKNLSGKLKEKTESGMADSSSQNKKH